MRRLSSIKVKEYYRKDGTYVRQHDRKTSRLTDYYLYVRLLSICCSICCFVALLKLPIEYYTFLRIIISITAMLMIFYFFKMRSYRLVLTFFIVLILFNPIFPFYLYRKQLWFVPDLITGVLFLLSAVVYIKPKIVHKAAELPLITQKTFIRDRIISPKKHN
jgi:magnesium-transporting ATPase (P-type)